MITKIEKTYSIDGITFNGYKMTKDNIIFFVPLNPANKDYQAILEYIEKGGEVIDNPPITE